MWSPGSGKNSSPKYPEKSVPKSVPLVAPKENPPAAALELFLGTETAVTGHWGCTQPIQTISEPHGRAGKGESSRGPARRALWHRASSRPGPELQVPALPTGPMGFLGRWVLLRAFKPQNKRWQKLVKPKAKPKAALP